MLVSAFFVASAALPLAATVGPSGPTQPGAPVDCILWVSAKEGDTASQISNDYNIPLETFMNGNPQLSGNPLNLWKGYDYCVPQGSRTPPKDEPSSVSGVTEAPISTQEAGTTHKSESDGETTDSGSAAGGTVAATAESGITSTTNKETKTATKEPGAAPQQSSKTIQEPGSSVVYTIIAPIGIISEMQSKSTEPFHHEDNTKAKRRGIATPRQFTPSIG
ncbi:hypothetical protein diail_1976 [Diaporthe ilicicola]|nr:hypothetical protein diail_1976 [Diaporthe ilicicola]